MTDDSYDEFITAPEFNKLTAENFTARLTEANIVTNADFDDILKNLNKINSNKTKHLIVGNEFKKLETFVSIYFRGKSQFEDNGSQNYFVFQTAYRYFNTVSNNDSNTLSWKSKGLSDESIWYMSKDNAISIMNNSDLNDKSGVL